jgi:cation transporter-like permease
VLGFATVDVYYVIGSVLAACALLVSLLGVLRKDFPSSRSGEIAVGAIFAVLVIATVSAAVAGALSNEDEGENPDHGAVPTLTA